MEDVASDPIFQRSEARDVMLKADARACQSTPLLGREGKVLGMISTHYRTPQRPDESKLRLIDLLARQTAEVVETAQIEWLLERNEQLAATAELANTVAHELNNPLQALTNLVALLSQQPVSEEGRVWLKAAQQEIDRMVQTTERLLVIHRQHHRKLLQKATACVKRD